MRKIVSLACNTVEPSYEREVFSKIPDVEYIDTFGNTDEEVINLTRDAEVILFTVTDFNRNVISHLEKCRLMIRYGIGYDNIDLEAAKEKGIYVCNSPKYGVIDVAEHALSLILGTAKNLVSMNDRIRDGKWGAGKESGIRLSGKTLGFLGFGNIGRALCERTNALGMKPLVYDPYVRDDVIEKYGAKKADLYFLLENSDFVTSHLPLNDETYHILGEKEFSFMKKSAILINTSRGGIVNENELIEALEKGEIKGAALDVFEKEGEAFDRRLLNYKNVILTPHVAWNTPDAILNLHREVADNVLRYFMGEKPESIVNL